MTHATMDPCRHAPYGETLEELAALDNKAIPAAEARVRTAKAALDEARDVAASAERAAELGLDAAGVRDRLMTAEQEHQDASIHLAGLVRERRSAEAARSARAPQAEEYVAKAARETWR